MALVVPALPRPLAALALAALLAGTVRAPAQQTAAASSAPISDVSYRLTFDSALARRVRVHVDMSFTVPAGDAPVLNRIRPVMARVGHVGLELLWLTGAALIWCKWGGPSSVPALFWWKLALVVVLTGLIGYIDLTMRAVRQGNLTAAVRLPMLGMAGTVLLVLIVTIAVFAFN